jgi:Cu/Ag efflux protein CusF
MSIRLHLSRSLLHWALVLAAGLLLPACSRSGDTPSPGASPGQREYDVRGIIRSISADRSTLEIQHEAIGDFMPAMTMPFSVKVPALVQGLNVGDAVAFRMRASTAQMWIESIRTLDASEVQVETGNTSPAPPETGG